VNLEQELRTLAAELAWPETPALRPELGRRRDLRPLVVALAVLVLALGAAFAVPQARGAILRFLHLGGVTIERVEQLPPAEQRSLEAGLGPARSLAEAARIAGFEPVLPRGVSPARAYARPGIIAIQLGGGRLLSEINGGGLGIAKKFAGPQTRISGVTVDGGEPGMWLVGGPHVLFFTKPNGTPDSLTLRLAGNVLLWEHGTLTLRLEGPFTLAEAMRLAATIPGRSP
jgi:hypothetical protein